MQKFTVDLTEGNVRKIINGYPIQLSKTQLNGNNHHLMVHPLNHKKMSDAKAKGKGVRLTLTQPEAIASATGFKDFWDKVKTVGQWVKKNVIDTSFYQSNVRPVVKELVDKGVAIATPMLGPVAPIAKAGVEELSKQTGAFGIKANALTPVKTKRVTVKPRAKKAAAGSFLIQ